MKVQNDLSELNMTVIDLSNTKIFINQSLCSYYKLLWSKKRACNEANSQLLRFKWYRKSKT